MSTMEPFVKKKLYQNSVIFKRSLDQIVEKYSKLQHQDGGIEVDLNNTKGDTLERYMNLSTKELSKLQSKNLAHLSEESLSAQNVRGDSQLDITHKDEGGDEIYGSTTQFAGKHNDTSLSLLDRSLGSFSEEELQPEDQDEELQMSLSSNGSSLVELYPSMVSRLGRAWHQQHVSVAADSVLRRYRRWRQQSKRRDLNNTFDVTLKCSSGNQKRLTRTESASSGVRRQLARTETTPEMSEGQQSSHVFVIDFSEQHEPEQSLLNETFTVRELSPPEQPRQVSMYAGYPSQPLIEASVDPSFRLRRLSESSHSSQRAPSPAYETETTGVKEISASPRRQSPFRSRLMAGLSRSPRVFSKSPRKYSVERCSQEPERAGLLSSSLSSCPERPVVQLKLLRPQDSVSPSQPPLCSPRHAEGRHRLRRHLSFDSALSSNSYSPKKVDEDFMKLYHKFACQNKSARFNGPPCRLCTRSSKSSQGSPALAALALSPHRSVLRKRYRELEWDSHSQSKRFREEHCASSPGSQRHRREMLRQRLSLSGLELSHGGLSYSPSKHRVQRQEAWMSQPRPASDAPSGLGGSPMNSGASFYSPRRLR